MWGCGLKTMCDLCKKHVNPAIMHPRIDTEHSDGMFLNLLSGILTLSQTSPGSYVSAVQVYGKHCGKWRNCS